MLITRTLCLYLKADPCLLNTWISWEADLPAIDWRTQPGWDAWRYAQYVINHAARVTQSEARHQCQMCGGDLLSVANLQEHEFIISKL